MPFVSNYCPLRLSLLDWCNRGLLLLFLLFFIHLPALFFQHLGCSGLFALDHEMTRLTANIRYEIKLQKTSSQSHSCSSEFTENQRQTSLNPATNLWAVPAYHRKSAEQPCALHSSSKPRLAKRNLASQRRSRLVPCALLWALCFVPPWAFSFILFLYALHLLFCLMICSSCNTVYHPFRTLDSKFFDSKKKGIQKDQINYFQKYYYKRRSF